MIQAQTTFNNVCGDLRIVHRDRNANIVADYTQPIDSHIQQFWNNLAWAMVAGESTNYTNLSSGTSSMIPITRNLIAQANGIRGINIGSGSSAVAYGNINITRIGFGGGTGQLVADDGALSFDFATGIGTVTRTFTNTNIATVTVRECSLAMSNSENNATATFNAVRDLLSSEVTLGLDDTLTITYAINFANGTDNWARLWGNNFHCRSNTNVSFINTTGVVFSAQPVAAAGDGGMRAGAHDDGRGLVVGTDGTAAAWGDYALGAPISNGDGAGELVYGACVVPIQTALRTTNGTDITMVRLYVNRSGGDITIRELGIYSNVPTGLGTFPVMYNRTVVDPPVTVTNGNVVVASWAIRYNFT